MAVRFSYSKGRIIRGNADPRVHSDNPLLRKLPTGTLLVIDELFDPDTCTKQCASGLFLKASRPDCKESCWREVMPIELCCDVDDPHGPPCDTCEELEALCNECP